MKDKEKATEEEKKETKPEENGVKLTDEQLEQVTGGAKAPDSVKYELQKEMDFQIYDMSDLG